MTLAVDAPVDEDVDLEWLRASYEAFVQRRLQRGALSIRTRQGYERLREKYQPRIRFVQDAACGNDAVVVALERDKDARGVGADVAEAAEQNEAAYARYSDEEDEEIEGKEEGKLPIMDVKAHVVEAQEAPQEPESAHSEPDSEASALRQLIGVFFDPKVKRLVQETLWPLAHHGGSHDDRDTNSGQGDATSPVEMKAPSVPPRVPEWQELEQHKYYALVFKTLLWLFPGLPAFEAQEHAERDWIKDCEFDAYGSYGLSFEGFMVSLLDLALACTDGSVDKCVEFLSHMTKQLEMSLPVFRVPTTTVLHSATDGDDDAEDTRRNPYEQILWRTVQLMQLFPCAVNAKAQYLELKTKLSSAPIVLMVLASHERPLELQLSTSAKLLVRERDHRSSVRRNTMHSGALAHFIEIERQFLWTFRSFPARPTLLIVPSALVSKRTLTLYACCMALESHEHSLQPRAEQNSSLDPLLTLFTAVPEPFPLLYGTDNSLCGRIDRHSSKLLVIDHRGRSSKQFKIIFKTSLIHNTSAAGGAGAAAVVASLANVDSIGTAHCTSELVGGNNQSAAQAVAHSFIFVVKMTSDVLANGPQKRRASTVGAGKGTTASTDASVPAQWFTTFCGANENKTIFVDTDTEVGSNTVGEDSTSGLYYVYVFTLHGFYFEAVYEDNDPAADATSLSGANQGHAESAMSILTNQKKHDHALGSVVPTSQEDHSDNLEDWMQIGGSSGVKKVALNNVTNSAAILRQLLLLRKKRQSCPQPPPECIGGSKMTSMKSVTAAAGLRAKFLKARAVERRSRFLENEEALRAKVLAKLMKNEAKKRALRGDLDSLESSQPIGPAPDTVVVDPGIGAKATLLSNFFKEMAVYQPTQREIDEDQDDEQGEEADKLMEQFADLFADDQALHNMLDAEKWLTNEAKTSRRKLIMEERVNKRRQSLLELGKQQVPELDGHLSPVNHVEDEHKSKDRKKSNLPQRASEDYFSTAMLIRDLMREVAEEKENALVIKTQATTSQSDRVESLAASFTFAANSIDQPSHQTSAVETQRDSNGVEPNALEETRHEEWLTSHYVQPLGVNVILENRRSVLRPSFVPSSQHFKGQVSQLPWQPVWEVRDEAGCITADSSSNQAPEYERESKVARSSPQRRPKTATGVTFSPRPPLNQPPNRRVNSAAAQSANLARLNTRRIRSARAGSVVRQPLPQDVEYVRKPPVSVLGTEDDERCPINHVPEAFLHHRVGVDFTETTLASSNASLAPCDRERPVKDVRTSSHSARVANAQEAHTPSPCGAFAEVTEKTGEEQAAELTNLGIRPKRRNKKKISREEKRFAERVHELLSISPFGDALP